VLSVIAGMLGLSVCMLVTTVSPTKTAEPIETPFGLCTNCKKFEELSVTPTSYWIFPVLPRDHTQQIGEG